MKHNCIFVTLMLCMSAGSVFAQKQYLEVIDTEIGEDQYEYFYDSQSRLDSVAWVKADKSDYRIGGNWLDYDENGNMVKYNNYQIVNGDYYYTGYIDYEFDSSNRRTSRENYNFIAGEYMFGARIEYTYNDQGQIEREETLMTDWDTGELATQANSIYYYSEATGLLDSVVISSCDKFSGIYEPVLSGKSEYTYDDQGRLVSEVYSEVAVLGTGRLIPLQKYEYVFEGGNVVSAKSYNNGAGSTPNWRPYREVKYEYDMDVPATDVVYPAEPEGLYLDPVMEMSENMIVRDSVYNEFEGTWGLYEINNYHYGKGGQDIGVREAVAASPLKAFADGGMLVVTGAGECPSVHVYSAAGVAVAEAVCHEGRAEVQGLAPGMYIVSAAGRSCKVVVR